MRISLKDIDQKTFDVAIVGGGINGASAAQHLAAAGYSVVLFEKGDYASAASSRSTRVLHSGLRYMSPAKSLWEHVLQPRRMLGRFRSALESMSAYGEIVSTLPKYVKPMELLMPIYRELPYRGWHVDIGVRFLGMFKKNGVSLVYRRYRQGAKDAPAIAKLFRDQDQIEDFVSFRDFQFWWPERICLDAMMDARRLGAVTRNYTTVENIQRIDGGSWELGVRDSSEPDTNATVRAKLVLNTAGTWMDKLTRGVEGAGSATRRVIAVKGVHILVKLPPEFRGQGVAALNSEKEAIFALPWGDMHYLGPTETIYHGDLDDVRAEEDDIEFMVEETNHLFPSLNIKRSDVVMAWAGARPITYHKDHPKGLRLPFSVLHDLAEDGLPNMLSLTWGTINLHRVSARNILKAVKGKIAPSGSAKALDYRPRELPETRNSPAAFAADPTVTLDTLKHLAREEDAVTLVDVLYRRTAIAWRPAIDLGELRRCAEAVSSELGWDKARIETEIERTCAYAREKFHVEPA